MNKCSWFKPRVKIVTKFSTEFIKDNPEFSKDHIKKGYIKEKQKLLDKGTHLINPRIDSGLIQDDFRPNTFAVVITAYTVKVPRYLKRRLKRSNPLPEIQLKTIN